MTTDLTQVPRMPTQVLKLLSAAAPGTPDAELLGRFVAARDEAAFTELVRRHGPAVYRICRRLAGPSAADDAFQSTFLVLACRAKAVRKSASIGSWLIGVAGRVARQMRRKSYRGREAELEGRGEPDRPGAFSAPDSCLLSAELAAALDEELTRLPDLLRGPVVLCLIEGRTQEQAVADLGGSVRSLRRRLERAKALLRLRLERRGVVPAVAAGLVAGVGGPSAAVPPELARRAVAGVFEFLAAGGAVSTPAAVVAKGVVGSMAKLKASVAVAATAVVLVGFGVGWAGDPPAGITPPPVASSGVPEPRPPAWWGARDSNGVVPPEPFVPVPGQPAPATRFMTVTANFAVAAPTPLMARVIATEAEVQRREQAKWWLGKELPDWPKPCWIRVTIDATHAAGETTFTFPGGKGRTSGISGAEMKLHGSFLSVLDSGLPQEVTRTILATHFGKPLPRWADEGIALTAEPNEELAAHDVRVRQLLDAGRGIRLRVLFRMKAYPSDAIPLYAQGHSVVRFLLTRKCPDGGGRAANLIGFIRTGMDGNTDEMWNKAAKEVYGFESVDKLEEAWLDWLKTPESQLKGDSAPNQPGRIPPTKLSGAEPGKDSGTADHVFGSRRFAVPVAVAPEKRAMVREVRLFISRDAGKTWKMSGAVTPDKGRFEYEAPADGIYWISPVIMFRDGSQDPKDVTQVPPALKVGVDTTPPAAKSGEGGSD